MQLSNPRKVSDCHEKITGTAWLQLAPLDILLLLVEGFGVSDIAKFARITKGLNARVWLSATLWKRLYLRDIIGTEAAHLNTEVCHRQEYQRILEYRRSHNRLQSIRYAAENGYLQLLRTLLGPNPAQISVNRAMKAAAKSGHLYVIQAMLQLGGNDWYDPMIMAAEYGHEDIVNVMMDLRRSANLGIDPLVGIADINGVMVRAARGGHRKLIQAMIAKGANAWPSTMIGAAQGGHLDIIKSAPMEHIGYADDVMVGAAGNGHREIVQYMINIHGTTDWNASLLAAARGGHMDIINEMIGRGASNWNSALHQAGIAGHLHIVHEMITRGANNREGTLIKAAFTGHLDCLRECLILEMVRLGFAADPTLGQRTLNTALVSASNRGHLDCLREIIAQRKDNDVDAPLDATEMQSWTDAAQGAVTFGHIDCLRELISRRSLNWTAHLLPTAIQYDHTEIIDLLQHS